MCKSQSRNKIPIISRTEIMRGSFACRASSFDTVRLLAEIVWHNSLHRVWITAYIRRAIIALRVFHSRQRLLLLSLSSLSVCMCVLRPHREGHKRGSVTAWLSWIFKCAPHTANGSSSDMNTGNLGKDVCFNFRVHYA